MAPQVPLGAADAQPGTKKNLALAITDFLQTSLEDGTLAAEDRESIEVATSCIGDAFKIDPSDKTAVKAAFPDNQNLLSIFNGYEKVAKIAKTSQEGSSSAAEPGTQAKAEDFKAKGNVAMQKKDYPEAIAMYTKAIDLVPTNAIYLSNRAAAYSASKQHELAKNDAELATASDPKFSKGWSRLGLARFALGDAKGSMEAYKNGIEAEGNGGSEIMKKGYETAKRRVEDEGEDDVGSARDVGGAGGAGGAGGMPDLGALAGMLGGGGGGGGGGMPDLGALMNNPMLRQMAQNVMSNPDMMQNMMNNPQMRQMAEQYGGGGGGAGGAGRGGGSGGGGQPDLSAMMNDPSIQEMARNFMGGAGGAGGGAGRGA